MFSTYDADPNYEFDARFVIKGRISPLCGVRLWLPIDCHEDARIEVTGSSQNPAQPEQKFDGSSTVSRLISEIDPRFGLEIEAVNLAIRCISKKPSLKTQGMKIDISHIGSIEIRRRFSEEYSPIPHGDEKFTAIKFHLSDLNYGRPRTATIADHHGNRRINILSSKTLTTKLSNKTVKLKLELTHFGGRVVV